jgi:hypothetical protein
MPTSPTPERCPRCDRAECAFHNASDADVRRGSLDGLSDCHDNRVDWRARCLAAEKRADDLRADGNQLRDRLVKAFARIDRLMEDAPHAD